MKFKDWIKSCANEKGSRIVLALDLNIEDREKLLEKSLNMLRILSEHICAVKINRYLTLPLGLFTGVVKLVEEAHSLGLPAIMDCKMNDIGSTNLTIALNYFNAEFDALTASPYVGWEKGLDSVFQLARQNEKGIIPVVYLSHPGASRSFELKILDPLTGKAKLQYIHFAEMALEWNSDGVVVGATRPDKIVAVRKVVGKEIPIYSPGVGFQGGRAEDAWKSGADYLIVGRSIITAEDPVAAAEQIKKSQI
jgi:orotidine-5'-phosphate decarboxylase